MVCLNTKAEREISILPEARISPKVVGQCPVSGSRLTGPAPISRVRTARKGLGGAEQILQGAVMNCAG